MAEALFDKNLILVVDDDKEFTECVLTMLKQAIPGVKTIKAYDGITASSFCEDSDPKPALVILDMMLPRRSGFLVLEKIRRTSKDMPCVIMVTANEGSRHKAYAEMLGVFRYMRKPFNMALLVDAVRDALKQMED